MTATTRVQEQSPVGAASANLPRRDRYDVYAWWSYSPAYATNAPPFALYHEGGRTTVAMNQADGALNQRWNLLGTFTMAPGQGHRIELRDIASATVEADAVRLVGHGEAKGATWPVAIGQTGSYRVYAKWPVSGEQATDAKYTVTYQGGSRTVTVNQRVNGGQWTLLGSFPFSSGGTGYKVELSDDVTSGKIAADAIRYVLDSASSDSFTWTLAVPAAGSYQLYARWAASSANTAAARYTVTHAGGSSAVTASQRQNGGQWHLLGTYSFAPNAGHKVTLAAAADGTAIADAVLLAATAAPPANLLYIHADHLGTPQKLTDASQAIVWDGAFEPFGEEVAITGTAELPLRFPGQYADAETGYAYNHFRDYDPSLGRYLQSDPIGLDGGINMYAYARGNPIALTDPTGQIIPIVAAAAAACLADPLCSGPIVIGLAWMLMPKEPLYCPLPGKKPTGGYLNENAQGDGGTGDPADGSGAAQPSDASSGDKPSLVDEKGASHILEGDATGGGHRAGTGNPGKSEFPASWSDEKILGEISDVATDPSSTRTTQGDRTVSEGTRDGVDIRTVDDGSRIITGYPTNLPRN